MNFEIHYFDKCVACQTCIIIVGCMSNFAKWKLYVACKILHINCRLYVKFCKMGWGDRCRNVKQHATSCSNLY